MKLTNTELKQIVAKAWAIWDEESLTEQAMRKTIEMVVREKDKIDRKYWGACTKAIVNNLEKQIKIK